jgi:hypothetical protein
MRRAVWFRSDPSASIECVFELGSRGEGPPAGLTGEALADWLAAAPPGPAVLAALAAFDPASVSPDARLDLLVGWERAAGFAAAGAARVLAALTASASTAADPVRPEYLPDTVAAELRWSARYAETRLNEAHALVTRLPATLAELAAGRLNYRKAAAVVEATNGLPADVAATVETRVLPRADGQTVGELRRTLRRAVLRADPAGAEVRHARARAGRAVELWPGYDGMAELRAVLPAEDAVTVWTALDALAAGPRPPGDTRGVAARRADALTGLAAAALNDPQLPRRHRAPVRVVLQITAPALLGLRDDPGELVGYGPIPAGVARRLADDAEFQRLVTDPVSGAALAAGSTTYRPRLELGEMVIIRDGSCRFPGCLQPARRCHLDHNVPFAAGGATDEINLAALCEHHHQLKHHVGWTLTRNPDGTHTWTTLTGRRYTTSPADPDP